MNRLRRLPGLAAGPLVLLVLACVPESKTAGRTYAVRGLVRQLPSADRPQSELVIQHEAIPDFTAMDGKVVGMESMAMPFPVADPAALAALEVGDRIAFTLRVDWDASPPVRVERLEKLPADARLDFETPRGQ